MPKLIGVDWDAVKRDYLAGIRPQVLVPKYNVTPAALGRRIARHGWAKLRDKVMTESETKAVALVAKSLTTEADAFVNRVKAQTFRALDVLDANAPASVPEVERHVNVLEKVNKIGRSTFGLDGEGGKGGGTVLNLTILREEPQTADAVEVEAEVTPIEPVTDCQAEA